MLSGGIGITPLRSMIRYSTDKGLSASIVLLYSNSHEDDIVFEDDLESMARQNPNLKVVNTITRPGPAWKGLKGRIDRDMIVREVPDYANRVFFTSGPGKWWMPYWPCLKTWVYRKTRSNGSTSQDTIEPKI